MSMSLQLVPANENAVARHRAAATEKALSLFRAELQPRVRALARVHPWVADLATSFPALMVALALPRGGVDGAAGLRFAVDGAPLSAIAARLRVPMWLRAFPPQAFATALPDLPDDSAFRRRIANHLPKSWKLAPRWLDLIALAYEVADADVALWFAREAPLLVKRNRYARRAPQWELNNRLVALFAWHSARESLRAGVVNWNPDMQWPAALAAAFAWRDDVSLRLQTSGAGVDDVWFEPGTFDGYDFMPIRTTEEIDAEAAAMTNCVRGYGPDLADNYFRLWSVRKNGARVATLSLTSANGFLPGIQELSGPANAAVSADVWVAAHRWVSAQDPHTFSTERFARRRANSDGARWRALWRTYWLAKRRIPPWLPLRGDETTMWGL